MFKDGIPQRPVLDGFFRLYFQNIVGAAYLSQYAFHLTHIFFGLLQFALSFGTAYFKPCNTCRLFKQIAAVFRLAGKNLVYLSLLHNGIRRLSDTRIPKKLPQLFEPHRRIIDKIFAFSRPVEPALYGNFTYFKI